MTTVSENGSDFAGVSDERTNDKLVGFPTRVSFEAPPPRDAPKCEQVHEYGAQLLPDIHMSCLMLRVLERDVTLLDCGTE